MPNEYEVELCYKMMALAYQSSKVDMRPSQIKKIMSLFFDDDVIAAVVAHFEAGTRPTMRWAALAQEQSYEK